MDNAQPGWVEGLEILRQRQRALPEAVRLAWNTPLDLSSVDLEKYRGIVTTGIGSSTAHAQYLAWLLRTRCGLSSWYVSSGSFTAVPHKAAAEQALIVFSQGLSPNARFPLSHSNNFGCTVLVTAAHRETGERAAALNRFREAGVVVVPMPVEPEYEVLMRIVGPMVGYVMALRLAAANGAVFNFDPDVVGAAIANAEERAASRVRSSGVLSTHPVTFVTTGGYGTLTSNLSAKVSEGLFLSQPHAVDALEFAHGTLQEASGKPRTFIALTRDVEPEAQLFSRVRATIETQHRWLEFDATLPEPLQILEHESAMNAYVLHAIAERHIDQRDWPAKGSDHPLYGVASLENLRDAVAPHQKPPASKNRRLADLTWSEVESRIAAGETMAIVPLGATEQHGPHLPLAVDTVVADALAERFCARVGNALHAPTIPIGCSPEHLDFSGTLSLSSATLAAVLSDVITSLVGHGFNHVVIFSAHGGNDAVLSEIEPRLRQSAGKARLTVIHGIAAIGRVLADASAAEGIGAEASGAHAGEFETSIIAGIRAELLRWDQVRAGLMSVPEDPQTLFYPSLRNHALEGVVGDPTLAAANRAERYLSAWVDFLVKTVETNKT